MAALTAVGRKLQPQWARDALQGTGDASTDSGWVSGTKPHISVVSSHSCMKAQ